MSFKCQLLILYGIWIIWCASAAAEEAQKRVFPTVIWSELGGDAVLPCDVSIPADDKINMILWFKDNAGIPIYSYDARGVDVSRGIHMAVSDLERRCLFRLSHDTGGTLKLFNITGKDRGQYKCRVDFLNSPTQQHRLALDLIELPSSLTIIESENELMSNAGPYLEDDELHLACIVEGGKPPPKILWRIHDEQIHGTAKETESKVISYLTVRKIPRNYNQKLLTCEANIPGLSKPYKKSVLLDVYVKPLAVLMLNGNNILKDGESFSFLCECFGSNPLASISWLLDGEPIRSAAITLMHTKNKTTSKLTIRAESSFNDKDLFCRCENEKFPEYYLEDKKILQVHYRPITSIILRSAHNFNKVKEGDNVTLECIVNANPAVTSITWYHNGRILEKETNHTIYYLKNISLLAQGEYSCEATNKEGRSKSQSLMVNVLHVPFCQEGTENQHIMAAIHELVILQCEVEPGLMNQHVQFFWTINNTMKISNTLDDDIQSSGKISILKYTPLSESDFGTLACWAQNDIGTQKKPCHFHLTLANKPERPRNCVANNTNEFLQISCEPGFDGGLKQYFVLEIRTANYTAVREDILTGQTFDQLSDEAVPIQNKIGKPLYKLQKESPVFDIFSLENGMPYILTLYAVNLKGRSEAVVLVQGLKSSKPSNTAGVSSESAAVHDIISLPSIYVTLISSALLIISLIILTAIILACRNRSTAARRRENVNNELNNFRIVYSDVENKRGSDYEPEF
ncbi:hemicentin-1-like isoform X2 [Planococcus citri]|uniref:hemicentin-1-like isoform X2 n=1 Tax=Planococcus citri TaxID=170843 RepID=UPI0031F99D25